MTGPPRLPTPWFLGLSALSLTLSIGSAVGAIVYSQTGYKVLADLAVIGSILALVLALTVILSEGDGR